MNQNSFKSFPIFLKMFPISIILFIIYLYQKIVLKSSQSRDFMIDMEISKKINSIFCSEEKCTNSEIE
jgi:hypothetical protein